MTTSFEHRERGFEAKFAHDEELAFRVTARRDKLFAAWLASKRQLSADEAHELEHAILAVGGGAGHDAAVLALVGARLGSASGDLQHASLEAALAACATRAAEEFAGGGG